MFSFATILVALFVAQGCITPSARDYEVKGFIVAGEQANAFLCRPEGKGPFPAVIFSHGRAIRDLQAFETAEELIGKHLCQKLASDGFLAFIPIRDFYLRDGPRTFPTIWLSCCKRSTTLSRCRMLIQLEWRLWVTRAVLS
jgi:dienelactone hydrolase